MVTAAFTPEAELTLFLCMRTEEIAKSLGKCMPIEEILPYYRKPRSPQRMAWSDFWPGAPEQPFRTWKSYYFMLTCMSQTTSTAKI